MGAGTGARQWRGSVAGVLPAVAIIMQFINGGICHTARTRAHMIMSDVVTESPPPCARPSLLQSLPESRRPTRGMTVLRVRSRAPRGGSKPGILQPGDATIGQPKGLVGEACYYRGGWQVPVCSGRCLLALPQRRPHELRRLRAAPQVRLWGGSDRFHAVSQVLEAHIHMRPAVLPHRR